MKRLVSTRHPGSEARVHMHAKAGESARKRAKKLPAFPTGTKCTYMGHIHISRRDNAVSRSSRCVVNAHI